MKALPENKRVLFFCAHPDDDTYSSGASMREMTRKGCRLTSVFLTTSPRGVLGEASEEDKAEVRKGEARESCAVVGGDAMFLDFHKSELDSDKALERVRELLRKERPGAIFLPHEGEAHPTHRAVSRLVFRAAAEEGVGEFWFWESWTPLEDPDFLFFFGEEEMGLKRKAMQKHGSQVERTHTMEATIGLNLYRGIFGQERDKGFAGSYKEKRYAEAFMFTGADS